MASPVGEFLKTINYTKQNILTEENEKEYVPFVINKCLSRTIDTVLYAQEMNQRWFIDKRLHYDFLLNIIRKNRSRFGGKIEKEKFDQLEMIQDYYTCNAIRAKEILTILSNDNLASIKKSLETGGVSSKKSKL